MEHSLLLHILNKKRNHHENRTRTATQASHLPHNLNFLSLRLNGKGRGRWKENRSHVYDGEYLSASRRRLSNLPRVKEKISHREAKRETTTISQKTSRSASPCGGSIPLSARLKRNGGSKISKCRSRYRGCNVFLRRKSHDKRQQYIRKRASRSNVLPSLCRSKAERLSSAQTTTPVYCGRTCPTVPVQRNLRGLFFVYCEGFLPNLPLTEIEHVQSIDLKSSEIDEDEIDQVYRTPLTEHHTPTTDNRLFPFHNRGDIISSENEG